MSLGATLRAWRVDAGRTQKAIADALAVDQAEISRLENGQRGVSAGQLARICDELNLTDEQRLEALRLAAAQSSPGPSPEAAAS